MTKATLFTADAQPESADLFDPSYYSMYIDRLEAPDLRVVVSLSGGASSAVAAQRADAA